jgi:hypothetical protein
VAAAVGEEVADVARRLKLRSLGVWQIYALRHKLITVDYALLLARVGVEEQNAPAAGRGPGTARRESRKS